MYTDSVRRIRLSIVYALTVPTSIVLAPAIIMRFRPIASPKKKTNRLPTAQPISYSEMSFIRMLHYDGIAYIYRHLNARISRR